MSVEPETPQRLNDQLRARWFLAIDELGPSGAADDAAHAFVDRMWCTLDEARDLVRRAWQTFSLKHWAT